MNLPTVFSLSHSLFQSVSLASSFLFILKLMFFFSLDISHFNERSETEKYYTFPPSLYKKLPINMWRVPQLEIGFKMIQTGKSFRKIAFCKVRPPNFLKSVLLTVVNMYLTRKLFFDLKKNMLYIFLLLTSFYVLIYLFKF